MGLSTSFEPNYLWAREFARAQKENPSLTAKQFNESLKTEAKLASAQFHLDALEKAGQDGLKKPNVKVG